MNGTSSIPLELLQRAFEKLPPVERELLLMVRVEGLSYAEIGERLGLGERGAEQVFARSLARLDRELERIKWQERRLWAPLPGPAD